VQRTYQPAIVLERGGDGVLCFPESPLRIAMMDLADMRVALELWHPPRARFLPQRLSKGGLRP
jgi:hypothetical protein